jgi:hypothetical protein
VTDLSAEDFDAINTATLDRIERMERETRQIDKAARQTEAQLREEIAGLRARLVVAVELPSIKAYYGKQDNLRCDGLA